MWYLIISIPDLCTLTYLIHCNSYCDNRKLQVNISKTKIVVFFQKENKAKPCFFYYYGETIEIVDDCSYFGY